LPHLTDALREPIRLRAEEAINHPMGGGQTIDGWSVVPPAILPGFSRHLGFALGCSGFAANE